MAVLLQFLMIKIVLKMLATRTQGRHKGELKYQGIY